MIDEEDKINRQRAINSLKSVIEALIRQKIGIENQVVGMRKALEILEDQKESK